MRLDLLIYVTNGEINECMKKEYKLVFSDSSHLILSPVNGKATIAFDIDVFIDIDVEKLWDNIKELIQTEYTEYDSVQLGLVIDPFLKKDQSIKDYINSVNDLFESKSDFFMYYYKELKFKGIDDLIHHHMNFDSNVKAPKIDKVINTIGASEVWSSLKEDQLKKLYGQFGYLVTGNKKLIEKDIKKIQKFVDEFIPCDSKFGKKFKKDLISHWISIYVRHINL